MMGGAGPMPFQPTLGAQTLNTAMSNALPTTNAITSNMMSPNLATAGTSTVPSSFQAAIQDPLAYVKANPFRFNPESYRPAFYADGGVASLPSGYDRMVGEMPMYQRMASGGISDLGSYSDGGRMLKGPGDGMSDSIPASIAGRRPARLATEEFVVPADVVSGLGNGSSDAGARQLYAMMDRVRKARTGTKKQGREINPRKYTPA
jgi:hypothetical protein